VVSQPRLVIAGTRSGDGKTTVATGLMAALRGRGLRVSAHKVGPDYIDPGYHAVATGSPGRNLDPFLVGEELIAPLFRHGHGAADVSVIEGVMGLFDGAVGRGVSASTDFASTAHVARLLAAPIVLVVSAAGAGRSIAATVRGFAAFDPAVQVAGVVLNRVSTARHEEILREALTDLGVPVLGALPAQAELHAPSRHLGLVPAAERAAQVRDWLPRLRALVDRHLDLDRLLAIARSAPDLTAPAWSPADAVGRPAPGLSPAAWPPKDAVARPAPTSPVRIAVAAGRAFTFGYAEHRELLAAAGAEVLEFDPLTDEHLPAGCDALIAGGGFPEVYAADLAANASLRAEVRHRAEAGMPVVAECGGLLWLGADLDGHAQCGVLPATARMTGKLTLGYREAVAATASPLAAANTTIRAHEFHRTISDPPSAPTPARWPADGPTQTGPTPAWRLAADPTQSEPPPARRLAADPTQSEPTPAWRLAGGGTQGWASDRMLASYLHVHWAGLPEAAPRLLATAQSAHVRQIAQPRQPAQSHQTAQSRQTPQSRQIASPGPASSPSNDVVVALTLLERRESNNHVVAGPVAATSAAAGGVTPATGAASTTGDAGSPARVDPTAASASSLASVDPATTTGPEAVAAGTVTLIGAGPGGPDLITVRGWRALQVADVVVADRLADPALISELRPGVLLIDAGKAPGRQRLSQDQINEVLVEHARAGRRVARLKGGDPFVFGRGGEEAVACAAAGISCTVIPGLSSATAAPALAGIPVTHRDLGQSFCVVSGHLPPEHPDSRVNWPALAVGPDTLVLLMAVRNLSAIAARLIACGRVETTPAACVERAGTDRQRVHRGTLAELAHPDKAPPVSNPAVIIIGPTAGDLRRPGRTAEPD